MWWQKLRIKLTLVKSSIEGIHIASFHLLSLLLSKERFVNGEALKIWKGDASSKGHPHFEFFCLQCCWMLVFWWIQRGSKILAQPWLALCTNRTYNLHENIWRSLANNFVGTNFWGYTCDTNKYDKRERTQPISTPNCTGTGWSTISLLL